jgi:hypothetical protein
MIDLPFECLYSSPRWDIRFSGKSSTGTEEPAAIRVAWMVANNNLPAREMLVPVRRCDTFLPDYVTIEIPDPDNVLKVVDKLIPVRKSLLPLPI